MSATRGDTLAVLGAINVDLVVRGSRLPAPGETVMGGEFSQHQGGKGGNQAVAAARLGARRVYLVDPEDILEVAREVVRDNGLTGVVECLRARIEDVRLPERADVIVSVLTGNFLVTEDLLETLFFARDELLAPGGILVPSAARMEVTAARVAT